MTEVLNFMWMEQARGSQTLPFFRWVPIEQRTGETIWRLWLLTGWTNQFASSEP